jgi:DNA-binding NarL/FixJ family response regulator
MTETHTGTDTHAEATAPVRIVVADDHEVVRAGYAGLLATQADFTVVGTARDGAEAVRICRAEQPDVVLMDVRMPVMDGIQATAELMAPAATAAQAMAGQAVAGQAMTAERAGPDERTGRGELTSQHEPTGRGEATGQHELTRRGEVTGRGELRGRGEFRGLGEAAAQSTPRVLILTTFDLDEHVYDALAAGASGFLLKDVTAERLFEAVRVVAAGEALLAPAITRRLIAEFARLKPRMPARKTLGALTPRETEVLRLIAEGLSNPEIALRLHVGEETVKTHVSRVLSKLGLRDRTQAVVTAYESGLVVPRAATEPLGPP